MMRLQTCVLSPQSSQLGLTLLSSDGIWDLYCSWEVSWSFLFYQCHQRQDRETGQLNVEFG